MHVGGTVSNLQVASPLDVIGSAFSILNLVGTSNTHFFQLNDTFNTTFFYGSNSNASLGILEASSNFKRTVFNRYGAMSTGDITLTAGISNSGSLNCVSITTLSNVGIGTAAPISKLMVAGGDISVYNGSNSTNQGGAIKFGTAASPALGEMASIKALYSSSNGNNLAGGLSFYLRPNNATSNTSLQEMLRLSIDSGSVYTPYSFISDVSMESYGNIWTQGHVIAGDYVEANSYIECSGHCIINRIPFGPDISSIYLQTNDNGSLDRSPAAIVATGDGISASIDFKTNPGWASSNMVSRLYIGSTGNVGIGTTSPETLLDVNGSSTMRLDLALTASNGAWSTAAGKQLYMRYATQGSLDAAYIQSIDRSTNVVYNMGIEYSNLAFASTNSLGTATPHLYLRHGGNVGVGTNTPGFKLDVSGIIRASGNIIGYSPGSAIYFALSNSNVEANIGLAAVTNQFASGAVSNDLIIRAASNTNFYLQSGPGAAPGIYIRSNNNIGIGTSSPAYKLDVSGTFRATEAAYFDSNMVFGSANRQMLNLWETTHGIGVQNGTTYFRTSLDYQFYKGGVHSGTRGDPGVGGSALMTIKDTGNIGIGTTSPSYPLDVNGYIQSSNLIVGENIRTYSATMTGLDSAGATAKLIIPASGTVSRTAARIILTSDRTNAVQQFAQKEEYELTWCGTSAPIIQSLLKQGHYHDAAVFNAYTITTSVFYDSVSSNLTIEAKRPGSSTLTAKIRYTVIGQCPEPTVVVDTNVPTGTQVTDCYYSMLSNGNIGIGTATPTTKLDVNGNVVVTGNELVRGKVYVADATSTSGSRPQQGLYVWTDFTFGTELQNQHGTWNTTFVTRAADGGFAWKKSDGVLQMYMDNNGELGIGTSAPAYRLDVSGTIRATSALAMLGYNPSAAVAFTLSNSNVQADIGLAGVLNNYASGATSNDLIIRAASNNNLFLQSGPGNPGIFIRSNNSIGIGTTTPSERLMVVNGDIKVANGSGGGAGGALKFGHSVQPNYGDMASIKGVLYGTNATFSTASGGIAFFTRSNNATVNTALEQRMVIGQEGRVGIGTTTPAYTLDINGDAEIAPASYISVPLRILNPAVTNNQTIIPFGKGATNFNAGFINFQHLGTDGSQSNFVSIGVWGQSASAAPPLAISGYSNVGIGTSTPTEKLQVIGDVMVSNGGNAADAGGAIDFGIASTFTTLEPMAAIKGVLHHTNGSYNRLSGGIAFNTRSNNASSNTTLVESMRLTHYGFLGIGTTTPSYPFTVIKSANAATLTYGYLNSSGVVGTATGTNVPISIYASNRITCSEFNAFSDARIKIDINDIDDPSALSAIRQIQPKRYKYIDNVRKTDNTVWGFVAQQIAGVLPYATGKITDWIPNVFAIANLTGSKTLVLESGTFNGLIQPTVTEEEEEEPKIKLRLHIDEADTEQFVHVANIVNETTIEIEEDVEVSRVFIFGQEVKDFHTLNKDAIFTIGIAALQEVDRQVQAAKAMQTMQVIHPVESEATLVHSAVYAPRCDVMYRGIATLSNGVASVNLDVCAVADPSNALAAGTFETLCRNPQCFLQNNSSFDRLRGAITGGTLNIECEDATSTDVVHWMVVAERKDAYVMNGADGKTNASGYLKTTTI
jgi:hypothetical protein